VSPRLSQEELAREVRGIIASALQRPVEEVPLTAKLEGGLGVDSMAMIEINVALESRFNFAMPDMATPAEANLKTVEDVVKLVATQVEKAEAARRVS
jgi:acyl carrier protein